MTDDLLFHRAAVEAGYAPLKEYVEMNGKPDIITDEMVEAALDAWYADGGDWKTASSREFINRCRREMRATLEAVFAKMWRPITDTSPPINEKVLLGWREPTGEWNCIVGCASFGWRTKDVNNISQHSRATQWMPLPKPPKESAQ